jgi:hypothetical protein
VHLVHPNTHVNDDPFGIDDDAEIFGEASGWIMDTHDAFSPHCESSGTMPQAVRNEEPNQENATTLTAHHEPFIDSSRWAVSYLYKKKKPSH